MDSGSARILVSDAGKRRRYPVDVPLRPSRRFPFYSREAYASGREIMTSYARPRATPGIRTIRWQVTTSITKSTTKRTQQRFAEGLAWAVTGRSGAG